MIQKSADFLYNLVWACVHECRYLLRLKVLDSPGSGISCGLPDMGAGNQPQVLNH